MNQEGNIHQILLKLLDGSHRFLNFTTPTITIQTLAHKIQTLTSIPSHHQFLLLHDETHHSPAVLDLHDDAHQTLNLNLGKFPVAVHLLLRLRGGKGGFGSLLRGAATKAGQKKTNNFDACRDMSGRRLRHVNAEKKLEEWRAEAEERKLEKMAEEFIKKKAKEMMKKGKGKGGVDMDKYVQKYREDSAKCMEEVERSVRESLKGLVTSKRKGGAGSFEGNGSVDAKRLKIWVGKRKLADSDTEDDSDEDEDEDNNKSVVIDNADHSDSSKEAEGSSGSVTEALLHMISSDTGSSENGSEEEKESIVEENWESGESGFVHVEAASETELEIGASEENTFQNGDEFSLQTSCAAPGVVHAAKAALYESCLPDEGGRVSQAPSVSISGEDEVSVVGVGNNPIPDVAIQDEVVTTSPEALNVVKPVNFEEINSAAELEVLGMERLKSELQARGLKCGGTLQERAARLFLLKTTPVEMLPKKLLAKK